MPEGVILGIDTSAYTTSLCVLNRPGDILFEDRILLKVGEGARGLRQSEAFYQHVRNLPALFEKAAPILGKSRLLAVGVSGMPERREGSFMPVFQAGLSVAKILSSAEDAPLFILSHQEGHLLAAQASSGESLPETYLAVHFSGGTSEVLKVENRDEMEVKVLARSLDLKAGQLIDRTGVKMGLPFPAGAAMDRLALEKIREGGSALRIPSSMEGASFHFSGPENRVSRLIDEGADPGDLSLALFRMIAKTLEKSLRILSRETGARAVLLSGGVTASLVLREELERRLRPAGIELVFSAPRYASDNAYGAALYAWRKLWRKEC